MAKLEITSNTTVKEFADEFKKEFGATLRVYNGRSEADSDATLVSLGAKTGIVECRASRTVGRFVKMMQNDFDLKVKVRTSDDWVTVIDGLTLNRINDLPKNPTKTQMEDYVSYQRKDIEPSKKNQKESVKDYSNLEVKFSKIEDISEKTIEDRLNPPCVILATWEDIYEETYCEVQLCAEDTWISAVSESMIELINDMEEDPDINQDSIKLYVSEGIDDIKVATMVTYAIYIGWNTNQINLQNIDYESLLQESEITLKFPDQDDWWYNIVNDEDFGWDVEV